MFPREYAGQFAENDIYIECQKGVRIYHFGNRILECYIPSLIRGHRIVKEIQSELGDDVIFHIEESDSELLFRFNSKHIKDLEKYLHPKTNCADRSPFSSKYLPRNKEYKIPDEDLSPYKELVSNLPQNQLIFVGKYTTSFLQSLATKKNPWENIKTDMALKCLKGKEYIHSIGQWEKYIVYLKENIT